MISDCRDRSIGLLLSGGLDSAILLGHLLENGHRVEPLYIESDLAWQAAELRAAKGFLAALASPQLGNLVTLELPLADLYGNHWSVTGEEVPDAATPDEAVYLPGRNALLAIKAALWCHLHGIDQLALAPLASNPFSDATPEFFAQFESALNLACGGRVRIVSPFSHLEKRDVMRLGRTLPLHLTFSCIAPNDGMHCGTCNKCAERQAAFRAAGYKDLTAYATPDSSSAGQEDLAACE